LDQGDRSIGQQEYPTRKSDEEERRAKKRRKRGEEEEEQEEEEANQGQVFDSDFVTSVLDSGHGQREDLAQILH